MANRISDLAGWPIGVWSTTATITTPDYARATLKSASVRGSTIVVVVADHHGDYTGALIAQSRAEAEAVTRLLRGCLGSRLDQVALLEF